MTGMPRRAHSVPNVCRRLWNGIVRPVSDLGTTTPARLYRRRMALSIVRAEHPQPPPGQRRQRCDDPRHPAPLVVLRRTDVAVDVDRTTDRDLSAGHVRPLGAAELTDSQPGFDRK